MKFLNVLGLGAAAFAMTGCASILSDNTYPVRFDSNPSGAELRITDEDGTVVYEGKGPTTLTLKSGDGFFSGANYMVEASLDGQTGTAQLTPSLDGWYVGNILFGGIIGLLIVDPATGAMYKLPEQLTVNLGGAADMDGEDMVSVETEDGMTLRVVSIDQVPAEMRDQMVRVN
jgi:hypothetical protein